ncbi:ThiF family adenylyltransferase [Pseudalkalibacillus sp. SCS-8]|uniref:ThiF family adenylyltransferase n=1 Tax=Pseudalkalibacillus nanhaiensis TaxID=3115291 RepID=UPI0032DB486F
MPCLIQKIKEELEYIDQSIINNIDLISNIDPGKYRGCETVANLSIEVNGEPTVIKVGFPNSFPNMLPMFFDKEDHFGIIPHKELDGFLCFTRSETLIIDERYPASILLNCLEKVISVVEDGVRGDNKIDFLLEFEEYWKRGVPTVLYSHIDTKNQTVRMLELWWNKLKEDSSLLIAGEKNQPLKQVIKKVFHIDIDKADRYRCIYFPLNPETFLKPPIKEEWNFKTLKDIIFDNLTPCNERIFRKILKSPDNNVKAGIDFIVIGLPLPNENTALFGYVISGHLPNAKNKVMGKIHPFTLKPKDPKLLKLKIHRWHPNHMINRTGGNTLLSNKHVLIVGAGSIGSEVAIRFAKSGVGKISLIDDDVLELNNIHRHALGCDQVFDVDEKLGFYNKPKVQGIKEEINRKYPFTLVKSFPNEYMKVWEEGKIDLNEIDLVVVAIGAPNQEMLINRKMIQQNNPPPVLYTWVEPLGIGGHTLVTLNSVKEGCYQCLFKADGEQPIFNRSAFAKPFQEFSKTVTGCGSVFTPYNFMDSERTAMLTVDTGIKVLLGKLDDNPLLSWKGEIVTFKEQGFETTTRYSFSLEDLYKSRYLYKDENCIVCSIERKDSH